MKVCGRILLRIEMSVKYKKIRKKIKNFIDGENFKFIIKFCLKYKG